MNEERNLNNNLLDKALLAFFVTYLPIMILNIVRSNATGWTILSYTFPVQESIFLVTYLLRDKISFKAKKFILVSTLLLIGFLSYISIGMFGLGGLIFAVVVLIVALSSDKITTYSITVLTILLIIVVRVLITQNIVNITIDPENFFYNPISWTGQLIGYTTLAIVVIIVIIEFKESKERIILNNEIEILELSAIIERTHNSIIVIDQYKNIRYINRVFEQTMQRDKADFIGKSLSSLFELDIFSDLTTQLVIKNKVDETLKKRVFSQIKIKFIIQNKIREFIATFDIYRHEKDDYDVVVITATDNNIDDPIKIDLGGN